MLPLPRYFALKYDASAVLKVRVSFVKSENNTLSAAVCRSVEIASAGAAANW
jgi:hypothetical protein